MVTLWGPALKCQKSELEKVQHQATQLITGLKYLPYEQRLTILNMPTIAFTHIQGTMINTYKYATHKYKCQLLNFNTTSVTRSNGYKLIKNRCNTVKYQNFYTNSTVSAWNSRWYLLKQSIYLKIGWTITGKKHPMKFNATANPCLQS